MDNEEKVEKTLEALLIFTGAPPGAIGKMLDRMTERFNPDESKMRNVTPQPEQIEAPKE